MTRRAKVISDRLMIDTQGDTCWVNDRYKMIGRFALHAFEIVYEGSDGQGIWYEKRPGRTTLADWHLFQDQMKKFYKVWVPDDMMPERLLSDKDPSGDPQGSKPGSVYSAPHAKF